MKIGIVSASLLIVSASCCALSAEDKPEKPPADLLARCRKLLDSQIAVRDAAAKRDEAAIAKLSAEQKAIIADATEVVASLKKDDAAVAFTKVFEGALADIKRVRIRLDAGDVGAATQRIEDEIIAVLTEMIHALKTKG